MNPEANEDLTTRIARVDQPLAPRPLPSVGLRVRARTSPTLRGVVPLRLSLAVAAARGRQAWDGDPALRDRALRAAEAILATTARGEDVEAVARRRLVAEAVSAHYFWRPRQDFEIAAVFADRLRSAAAARRGVLVSWSHLEPFAGLPSAISHVVRPVYGVYASYFFADDLTGLWGRRIAHWRNMLQAADVRAVESDRSFEVIHALLRRGETVMLAFDMPGGRETEFLGKPVMLGTGTARLAMQTGAIVVPVRSEVDGDRVAAVASEPLDPRDHEDVGALHEAIARVHERWILETPELLEDPCRPGAWEDGATATRWSRPRA